MLTKNASPRTGKANLKKLLLILPLTIFTLFVFTKNSYSESKTKPSNAVWKKLVSRHIDMGIKEDTAVHVHNTRDVSPDTTLFEMLVNAVRAGKITAYSNWDHYFTTKLTKEDFNKIFAGVTDTMVITDPINGKETTKVIRRDFDYSAIHKYRILEEWTYNPTTGKTSIEILGINALKEIWGDDGVFRGLQGTFWLHYNDARSVLARYELYHPDNSIGGLIWDDYFAATVGPKIVQK